MGLSKIFNKKNTPSIFTGMAIVSMAASIIFAIQQTPKALKAKEEKEKEKGEPLTKIETVKTCTKYYIPTITMAVVSGLLMYSVNRKHKKRYATLLAAYSLRDIGYKEYVEATRETIGEKKEKQIVEKINQNRVDKDPVTNNTIILTGNGEALFYEPMKKLYFRSDLQTIRKAINNLNFRLVNTQYISYDDYLEELKLPRLDPLKDGKNGDEIGWSVFHYQIDPDFPLVLTDDDQPCICIDHQHYPPMSNFKDVF